tara:strand:- start:11572 stop:11769 length:198 start_codon:yes stop_codon:yes gene_type:complete
MEEQGWMCALDGKELYPTQHKVVITGIANGLKIAIDPAYNVVQDRHSGIRETMRQSGKFIRRLRR